MLLKDFNARFTLTQIRESVWFRRRHPPLTVDHFEQVCPVLTRLSLIIESRWPRYGVN